MENFKEKREAYLEMLEENKELKRQMLAETISMNEPRRVEIFLNPANEKELLFSETLFTFYKDVKDLTRRVDTGEIKDIPVEENDGLKAIIKMFKALLNNETDVKLIDPSLTEEEQTIAQELNLNKEDPIDYGVGIVLKKNINDYVNIGDVLCTFV